MTTNTTNSNWSPDSWKSKPIVQDVTYEDQDHADRVVNKLNRLPPMVSATEVSLFLFIFVVKMGKIGNMVN